MLKIFEIIFFIGALYAIISFVFGHLFNFVDLFGDFDIVMDLNLFPISPFKPIVLVSFITVFGGVGIICMTLGLSTTLSIIIAAASAIVVSFIIYRFIVIPLYKAQNTSAVSQKELIGHSARVKLKMIGNSFGSITYVSCGNTYTSPAKSIDGKEILRGEEVIILDIKNNVFYVDKLS